MPEALLLAGVVIAVILVARAAARIADVGKRARARHKTERLEVERRIADLLEEFPSLDDESVAILARDELTNRHVTSRRTDGPQQTRPGAFDEPSRW